MLARMRYSVALLMLKARPECFLLSHMVTMALRCWAFVGGAPPTRPRARADCGPAFVRSRMMIDVPQGVLVFKQPEAS